MKVRFGLGTHIISGIQSVFSAIKPTFLFGPTLQKYLHFSGKLSSTYSRDRQQVTGISVNPFTFHFSENKN